MEFVYRRSYRDPVKLVILDWAGTTLDYDCYAPAVVFIEVYRRHSVCATQIPAGRPHPWMVLQNMFNAGVYPSEAVVKVGNTKPDIGEGLNAGAWTVGLAQTGNEVGLNMEEINALDTVTLERRLARAREGPARSGAHYVVDSIADVPPIIDDINARLARGERPRGRRNGV
jgi:phosphonoacetaldehyde hydrolase